MIRPITTFTLAIVAASSVAIPAFDANAGELWVHPYVCKGGFFGPLRDDYLEAMTSSTGWQDVLARAHTVGFHMALLGRRRDPQTGNISYRATDAQLRTLAAFYREHGLRVNIEVGGVRFRPDLVRDGRTGVGRRYVREAEIPLLERWRRAGGSIDYLTIDHAVMMRMGEQAAGRTKDGVTYSLDELVKELAEALAELHRAFPDAEFAVAESLGHFRVETSDGNRTYQVQRQEPNPVSFARFIEVLKSSSAAVGVTVQRFAIDFQVQAAYRDATGEHLTVAGPFNLKPEFADRAADIPLDLGRAAAAAGIAGAADMRVVVMITPGAFGFGVRGDPDSRNDRRAFEAVRRMRSEYAAAGIQPDAFVHECWQPHPSRTGPETSEHSFMYTVRRSSPGSPARLGRRGQQ